MQSPRPLVQIVSGFELRDSNMPVNVKSVYVNTVHLRTELRTLVAEKNRGTRALISNEKSKNIKSWIILEKATSCSCLSLTMHQPDGNFLSIMKLNFQNVLPDYLIFIVELASTVSFCSETYQQPRPCITHAPAVW